MSVPDTDAPAASPPATGQPDLPILFRGSAGEYFGIWIVNLLLTLATLGIWSAWAKVRRKRYFLGSTSLGGDAFEYHATGGQILKGRLIVVGALFAFALIGQLYPIVGAALYIPLIIVLPWIANQSMRFNARMTSWRNVRFNFTGSYGKAFLAFLLFPFVAALSFGLLYPLAARYAGTYIARHHRFGTAPIQTDPRVGPFYLAALQAVGVALLVGAVLVAVISVLDVALPFNVLMPEANAQIGTPGEIMLPTSISMAPLGGLVGVYVGIFFFMARIRNIVVNAMVLGEGHRFRSNLSGLRLAWIIVSNFLVTVATIGLLRPWAVVRQYRYQAACLFVLPASDLGKFVDANRPAGTAIGSEYADIGGFDFGL